MTANITIALGADHAGYALKEHLKAMLDEEGITIIDFGTYSDEPADYPEFAHAVAEAVENQEADYGVLICGSGNGVAMTANKHPGIRAALCWNEEITRLARAHNDANIICFPGRFIERDRAERMLKLFLETPFEGGRHLRRINKIPLSGA